jgi:hypothetical protein
VCSGAASLGERDFVTLNIAKAKEGRHLGAHLTLDEVSHDCLHERTLWDHSAIAYRS